MSHLKLGLRLILYIEDKQKWRILFGDKDFFETEETKYKLVRRLLYRVVLFFSNTI